MNTAEKLVTALLAVLLGSAIALGYHNLDPPVIDPPAVVCQEVQRTPHPEQPGVFAVTHLCRLDLRGEITWEAPGDSRS